MELPAGRGVVFLLVAFAFFIILQDLQDHDLDAGAQLSKATLSEQHALHIISQASYGDFDPQASKWLNITGLTEDDSRFWQLFPEVKTKAISQAQTVLTSGWIETAPGERQRVDSRRFGERYTSAHHIDHLFTDSVVVPFYQNVTGTVRGSWVKSEISNQVAIPSRPSNGSTGTTYVNTNYVRNITGTRGHLHLRLDERHGNSAKVDHDIAQEIKAELTVENAAGDSWDISLQGMHFLSSGTILLSTSSDKFAGRTALPFLTRSEGHFRLAQNLLNSTLQRSLMMPDQDDDMYNRQQDPQLGDIDDETLFLPQCEYIVYLQQHLVWPYESSSESRTDSKNGKTDNGLSYLEALEDELRKPRGRSIAFIPTLRFSSVIFSPDCDIVIESEANQSPRNQPTKDHLEGFKIEVLLSRVKMHVAFYIAVAFLQLLLLVRQIKDASTPSTQSRISYYTIAMMTMADEGAMIAFMVMGAYTAGLYLPMISVTFFLFLCVPFFGLRFLVDVWSVQAAERQERERSRQMTNQAGTSSAQNQNSGSTGNQNSLPTVVVTPAGADLLPLPVTARRHAVSGATPVILPSDQDIDASIMEDELLATQPTGNTRPTHNRFNLGLKFLFSSFCLTVFSCIVSFWPLTIRSLYTNLLIFCYLSFWIPQIRRNMVRNCRKALRWEFVLGQSTLRLIPLAYFYVYDENVLFVRTDVYAFCGFAAWQWAQVLLLISQDALGPRFFLPAGVLPAAYDYHQILREGDEENGSFMPIGTSYDGSSLGGESREKGKWKSDCIICMHSLEVPYVERGGSTHPNSASTAAVSNIFARRDYMITPCRHIFHSQCLEGWMRYKLQCPMCRESLPPI